MTMSFSRRGFTILESLIMLLLLGGFGVTALAIVRKDFLGHDPNSKNELWKVFDFLPSIQGEGVTVEGLPPEWQDAMGTVPVLNENAPDITAPTVQPGPFSGESGEFIPLPGQAE